MVQNGSEMDNLNRFHTKLQYILRSVCIFDRQEVGCLIFFLCSLFLITKRHDFLLLTNQLQYEKWINRKGFTFSQLAILPRVIHFFRFFFFFRELIVNVHCFPVTVQFNRLTLESEVFICSWSERKKSEK